MGGHDRRAGPLLRRVKALSEPHVPGEARREHRMRTAAGDVPKRSGLPVDGRSPRPPHRRTARAARATPDEPASRPNPNAEDLAATGTTRCAQRRREQLQLLEAALAPRRRAPAAGDRRCSTQRDDLLHPSTTLTQGAIRRRPHPLPRRLSPRSGPHGRSRHRHPRLRGRAGAAAGRAAPKCSPLRDVAGMLRRSATRR